MVIGKLALEMSNLDTLECLEQQFGDHIQRASTALGELAIQIEPDKLIDVLTFVKEHPPLGFAQLTDICGVDYLTKGYAKRFEVVYHLLSLRHNQRIRIKVPVNEGQSIPSTSHLYPCANWFEREVFDLMGLSFTGHPDLRRILTDYGFEGHPLRKDFPLTGYVETTYDEEKKQVVYKPVELPQAFRTFDTLSPWEGMGRILEGEQQPHPTTTSRHEEGS